MFSYKKNSLFLATGLLSVFAFAVNLNADIVLVFTQATDGGVDVVGTGSGLSTDATTTTDFDSQDYNTDFLSDLFTDAITPATTVSGTIANQTSGFSETITGFRVDRDATSGDDIDFQVGTELTFAVDDQFLFNMTASFDVGTMAWTDLIQGIHTEDGGEFPDENFGQYTVIVVPEPGTLAAAGFLTVVVALRRKRS